MYKGKIAEIISVLVLYKKELSPELIKKINAFMKNEHYINDENILALLYLELKGVLDNLIEKGIISLGDSM